jgi:subtilisin-like proprotein convertase family protein
MVAAAIVVLGMPTPPASAAPLDHVTITANTPTHVEGNSGTTAVTFAIAYTGNPTAFSIDWATADGTATAGSDYVAAGGTVSFSGAGPDKTKTATVLINGDTTAETNETFTVNISNPQPAAGIVIDTPSATQTIADDDSSASFAIGDVTAAEGDAGSSTFSFAVTKTGSTGFTTSVNFATTDGTATVADGDYASTSGTLSFLPGDTTKNVDVTVNGDTKHETGETFTVDLSGPVNASIADNQGVGTITNDDQVPDISVDDQVTAEGNSPATTTMTFNVTLSNPSDQTVTVEYATNDGTATTTDGDYAAASGTVTFNPGQTAKTVDVTVNGDDTTEPDESLTLVLSNASNASILDGSGLGTITNDDPIPDVSIDDQSITEGNAGTSTLSFNVTLSHASSDTVSVDYTTTGGTATTADGDYVAASGTVTFDPGQTAKTVDVTVNGDLTHESDETFTVDLSNTSNAGVADASGQGIITNDDQVPDISIDDQSVTEGDAGTSTLTFNVTLSNPSDQTVTVDYATTDGTATTADGDYVAASGAVTFNPGQTAKTVDVTVNGDLTHESDETFTVDLSSPSNGNVLDGSGAGTITNDDQVPDISIDDQSVTEGDAGTSTVTFNVTLSNPSDQTVTVDYATTDGTATTADSDYDAAASTVSFDPGQTAETVDVTVNGDLTHESDESFTVDLSSPSNGNVLAGSGTGTILDDDASPTISVVNASVTEGNVGDTTLSFDVTLSVASAGTVTVDYTTTDGSATVANGDYDAASDTLTFDPGQTTETVDVTVHGDTTYETDEGLTLDLSSANGATIADDSGTGTITNDDAAPTFAIDDVAVAEGATGVTSLTFTVTKSGATQLGSSVHYATSGGTATAGVDYTGNSGTLSFAAGVTSLPVTVLANGDKVFEPNETVNVVLSAPTGGTNADATGVGTIINDDKQPTRLTIHRRLAPTFVIGKGLLEPATVGVRVRVAFFHRAHGHWVKIAAKTVVVVGLRDRDHDGLLDARYVARFKRPSTHGHYKLRARFAGSAALRRSHRGMNLTI